MDAASLALIAHDLKNALGALEGQLQGLVAAPTAAGVQSAHRHCTDLRREFVQFLTLYGPGQTLQALCEDESPIELLSALQRLAQQRQDSQLINPDSPPLVQISVAKAPPAGEACVPHGVPPYWYFDRRLVHMALDAALHNACRFARQHITLAARQQAQHLVLSIDDDGPGLGAIDPGQHSTGLGTSLCEAVARAHHNGTREGRITLATLPQGGTRFEMWLP